VSVRVRVLSNMAIERAAGSHSLTATAHRQPSADSCRVAGGEPSVRVMLLV